MLQQLVGGTFALHLAGKNRHRQLGERRRGTFNTSRIAALEGEVMTPSRAAGTPAGLAWASNRPSACSFCLSARIPAARSGASCLEVFDDQLNSPRAYKADARPYET